MNNIQWNRTKNNSGGQRIVDWEPMRVIPPGERGLPCGFCDSCALYIWVEGGYKIPGVRGIFCSIGCVECELFGTGHCRWCAAPLGSSARKFCDNHCGRQSDRVRFGDGTRLLRFLSHQHAALYEELIGRRGHVCVTCLGPLGGKNAGARFCSTACKMRLRRRTVQSRSCQKSSKKRNTNSIKSKTYEGPKTGPLLPPIQAHEAVEIAGERL